MSECRHPGTHMSSPIDFPVQASLPALLVQAFQPQELVSERPFFMSTLLLSSFTSE